MATLELTRDQILGYRRAVGALDEKLPWSAASLRTAAWAGLQDSVPRAALHALHARVADVGPGDWEDPALAQVWGPRYAAYVVPAGDHAIFTLARLPDSGRIRDRAYEFAARLEACAKGAKISLNEVAEELGTHPNMIRYAALTGTVLIRWDGARRPTVWTVTPPDVDEHAAREELARRHLHMAGPSTASRCTLARA